MIFIDKWLLSRTAWGKLSLGKIKVNRAEMEKHYLILLVYKIS